MLTIEYSENGICIADLKIEKWFNDLLKTIDFSKDSEISVGTQPMIDYFRVAVYTNRLSHKDIVFKFEGKLMYCNHNGKIDDWYRTFRENNYI